MDFDVGIGIAINVEELARNVVEKFEVVRGRDNVTTTYNDSIDTVVEGIGRKFFVSSNGEGNKIDLTGNSS